VAFIHTGGLLGRFVYLSIFPLDLPPGV